MSKSFLAPIRAPLRPGTQIAYIPDHADSINHPDVEFGFVTSVHGDDSHFCRYWQKRNIGQLRTVANSELTPDYCLVEYMSVPQELVEVTMEKL